MTDWLILLAFGVAWLAGWCSRWQWEKAELDRCWMGHSMWTRSGYTACRAHGPEPFDRWAKDVRFDSEYDGRGLRWDDEHP